MCTPLEIVEKAIKSFNEDESGLHLIKHNLSERSICSHLAYHVKNKLSNTNYSGYFVDVEYNRNGQDIKRINDTSSPITVDLIVHKHGKNPEYNLICIEMKKSTSNKAGISTDEERLCHLTCQANDYKYKLGVMVIIDKANTELRIKSIAENGQIIEKATPNM